MNKKEIMSVWAAFQEVQEKKKAPVTKKDDDGEGMDPVGKADGDIDNDGDKDSSDEYLANRRKKIGQAMKKEESEESPYPSLDKKKREKKGSNLEPAGGPSDKVKGSIKEDEVPVQLKANANKMKKGKLPNQKNEEEDVKEWSGKEGARRVAGGDKRKLKEEEKEVEEGNAQCPKCEGKGTVDGKTCSHCDGKGYHAKTESLDLSIFSAEELAAIEENAGEPFMSTSSAGEKKFYDDHKKSDKKFEDMEDASQADAVKAGRGVKSQSPARSAGDNLSNGDSKAPSKP